MEISFWDGDPLNGGHRIPGEVTCNEDGMISFRGYGNFTLNGAVYVSDGDGNSTRVPLQSGRSYEVHPGDALSVVRLEH